VAEHESDVVLAQKALDFLDFEHIQLEKERLIWSKNK